ncbi:hypothetical protein [Pendulispora albinea]|uniref:Vitamin K epoxide reductase domain-containing protein n=1 Tax=Pendulispora albinea TaxID=2741071 RepID=A0ABZ2M027_9BACT
MTVHLVNLLEPWVLLRLVAGVVAAVLLGRAALVALRVLLHFDLQSANEGQLALERHVELSSTFVRVGTVVQVLALVFTVLASDRLSHGIRGAMCAYGVFHANEWGFPALYATFGVALFAGIVAQVYAFDRRLPRPDLVRPLSILTLALAPLATIDLGLTTRFLLELDLSVVASCCSVQLDRATAGNVTFASGPRVASAIAAQVAVVLAAAAALWAARRPRAPRVTLAGALSIVAFPVAIAAVVLEVAPYAFELPDHICPFCLLHADVFGLGYFLFGAIFLATTWGGGAALVALLARRLPHVDAGIFEGFARGRMRREAWAWGFALLCALAPIARYTWINQGASLFP